MAFTPWGSDSVWGASGPWGGSPGGAPAGATLFPLQAALQLSQQNLSLSADTDIVCLTDLDPYFSLVASTNCLAQDLVHGISTQQGTLFYDGSWGFDIRQQLNGAVTVPILNSLSGQIQWQWGLDERVQNSTNSISWDGVSTLVILGTVTPVSGTGFNFVIQATAVNVSLLSVS